MKSRLFRLLYAGYPAWLLIFACHISCSKPEAADNNTSQRPPAVSAYLRQWSRMITETRIDSLIASSSAVFREACAKGDSTLTAYAGVHAAQAHLFKGQLDSAISYIDRLDSASIAKDNLLSIISYNIKAVYAMKVELNYTEAAQQFENAYRAAAQNGNRMNMIAQLCNISTVYYECKDTSGLKYARQAVSLCGKSANPYLRLNSYIVYAQLGLLAGNTDIAGIYADSAQTILTANGMKSYQPVICCIRAGADQLRGNTREAERNYLLAIADSAVTDTESNIASLSGYGRFLLRQKRYGESRTVLEKALQTSWESGVLSGRSDILLALSDVCNALSDKDAALRYYSLQHSYADSIRSIQREREFQKFIQKQERRNHSNEMKIKELEISRIHRTTETVILILALITVASASATALYRKKMQMYRQAVEKYDRYYRSRQAMREERQMYREAEDGTEEDTALLKIYRKIEDLMHNDKLHRNKDVSLDMIASCVNSNKSYVSKAINRFGKMSFWNYINMYRIEDAVSILSDLDQEVSLKILSDRLGFNSTSTFYRAFQKETGCPPLRFREELRQLKRRQDSADESVPIA